MLSEDFLNEMQKVSGYKAQRYALAEQVCAQPTLIHNLIQLLNQPNHVLYIKAAWVLELVCVNKLELLAPFLDDFVKHLKAVNKPQAKRSFAKIGALIATAYANHKPNKFNKTLTTAQLDVIVETNFDWLIANEKVAVKVHAMETLFQLGKTVSWIHLQLKSIIERDFYKETDAYKARAKHILKRFKS